MEYLTGYEGIRTHELKVEKQLFRWASQRQFDIHEIRKC